MSLIKTFRDLDVYKLAMEMALRIFELTRTFPAEEKYCLLYTSPSPRDS